MSRVIRYKTDSGNFHGLLVKETPKKVRVVLMKMPIRMVALPKSEMRFMAEIDYPVAKCKKALKAAARQWRNKTSKPTREALR